MQDSEERFRTLVSNIPGIVYRCENDKDWTMYYISDSIENLTGFPPSDFLNKKRSIRSFIHSEDLPIIEKIIAESIVQNKPYVLEYRIKDPDGKYRWIHDKGVALKRDDDSFWLDGVFFDVTKEKETELKLQKSEYIYRALFERTSDAVFIINLDLVHVAVNKPAADLLGYTVDELVGMRVKDVVAEKEYPDSQQIAEMLLFDRSVPVYERVFKKKNGEEIAVEINVALVRDANNQPLHYQSIVRDITERKKAEELQKAIFDNTFNAMVIVDLDGRIIQCNNTLCVLSGFLGKELREFQLKDLTVSHKFANFILNSCKRKESILNFQTTLIHKFGFGIPIEMSATLIPNHDIILISIKDLRIEQKLTKELGLLKMFSADQIKATLIKVGNKGPEMVVTEDLSFAGDRQDETIMKMGLFYSTTLGQGNEGNVGFFGPFPVANVPHHVAMCYSSYIKDRENSDIRMNGKSFSFIVFSMPESLVGLFSDRKAITDIIEKRLENVSDVNDISREFLNSLKRGLLYLPEGEPVMISIIDDVGFNIFTHPFIDEKEFLGGNSFNFFNQMVFSTSGQIEQIRHENFIMLSKPVNPLIFCYVYRYQDYNAWGKLESFVNSIRESPVWDVLTNQRQCLTSNCKAFMEKMALKAFKG
ncbi:MAG: PAS domain S-box protein [Candidatus Hodarchaeales archaeon]